MIASVISLTRSHGFALGGRCEWRAHQISNRSGIHSVCMGDALGGNAMKLAERNHGMKGTKVHYAWRKMRDRCNNPNAVGYKNYGGRGITICERWQNFRSFYSDMGDPPSPSHSLDRIDNNGNYEPGNCRWATPLEQGATRRANRFVTAFGETLHVAEWARRKGINPGLLRYRLNNGIPPETALSMPINPNRQAHRMSHHYSSIGTR